MAIPKNGLTIFALLVTFIILETVNIIEISSPALPERNEEQQLLPHTREKRRALTDQWNYIIDVVLNASNVETFEGIRSFLNATSLPIQLDNNTDISDISITTVCSSTANGFHCRCEEQYAWPYSICVSYGACDYISNGICKCINAIPADGQSCQPISELLALHTYIVDVELNVTDVMTVDYLRSFLNNGSVSLALSPTVNITDIDITTVCYPNGTNFQCICEDQYVWSSGNCMTYGPCHEIVDGTCSCISSFPSNGQYCHPKTETTTSATVPNTTLLPTTPTVMPDTSPVNTTELSTTAPTTMVTTPPFVHQYIISVELNISDGAAIEQLRTFLSNISYPISINNQIQISNISISTVCSQSSGGFQCRCEDQYLWPCDLCLTYGSCNNITGDTCGCINAIPDGQYCRPADQYNFTACSFTTTPSPTETTTSATVPNTTLLPTTPTVMPDTSPVNTTELSTTAPTTMVTTPPFVHQYIISVELNISDGAAIEQLRTFLSNISYPISINNQIQISNISISTVCSQSSGGFQCRCEDQYLWPCDLCLTYGSCNNITGDTCGCINAIPDGQYCRPADQYNFTACSFTTTTSPTETTTFATVQNTTLLPTTPTVMPDIPPVITTELSVTIVVIDMNTTTVAIPTPTPTNSTTDVNTTTVITPTVVSRTDSTSSATTHLNTTTPTIPPTTMVTDSTSVVTPYTNTTTAATPTAIVTNSTLSTTTHLSTMTPTISPTMVTNSTLVTIHTTTATTPTAVVTNFTQGTTTPTISSTTVFTNSTSVATTATNPTAIVTNSTSSATTHLNTTTPTISPATVVTSSMAVATTHINTTMVTTPTAAVTNSTAVAATSINTITPATTTAVTSQDTTVSSTTPKFTSSTTTMATFTTTTPTMTTTISPPTLNSTTTPPTITTTPTTLTSTTTTTATTTTTTPPILTNTTTPPTLTSTTTSPILTNATTPPTTTTTTTLPTSNTTTTTPPTTTTTTTPTSLTSTTTTIPPTSTSTTTPSTTTTTTTTSTTTTTTSTTTTTTTPSTTTTTTTSPTTTTTTTDSTTSTTRTSTTTTTTTTPALPPSGFEVEMSIRLDKVYTPELNDPTSFAYKDLESKINSVLRDEYKGITGFINVFVKAFREGSIITDFVVQTTEVNPDEMAEANKKLPEAMTPVAPVIGSITALYNSPTSISFSRSIYTGQTMTLTCGPPENLNVGQISSSEWKFKGREIKDSSRIKITTSDTKSMLTVKNVILADSGLYECTLNGRVMTFLQKGLVGGNVIKQAPILRLQSKVNIKCKEGKTEKLQCCVQSPYRVKWFQDSAALSSIVTDNEESYCIRHDYQIESCSGFQQKDIRFICKVDQPDGYEMTTVMTIFRDETKCSDDQYGTGRVNDISRIGCSEGQEGHKTAVCQETGIWKLIEDACIVTEIKELLIESQDLTVDEVPQLVLNLSKTTQEDKNEIVNSSATISAIVEIISIVANVSSTVSETVMQNVLETVDVIIGDDSRESWAVLNANETANASSEFLGSMETLSNGLVGEFQIETQRIFLNRTTFNNSFRAELNSSIVIDIPETNIGNVSITTITFSTLNNVMPARNSSFDSSLFNATNNETVTDNAINAAVVLVKVSATIQNVTLTYKKLNNSLSLNPQCVFWNFTYFDNLGAWDDEGCAFVSDINNTVTCSCNHLTSFSLLMATDIPPDLKYALDVITYVGVGISLASLIICLIIEGYVWKAITRNSTAFMRHVSIINTALSLLIADICFIIGSAIAKNPLEDSGVDYKVPVGPCSTATFFMHFFYLALFFWMLVSGLLLFYRTVMVFSHMSKSTMLAVGFSLGYGCPLIIAVITVAVTAPKNGYIREENACWLNWTETKALLALVIPALIIVFINILIVIVVLFKMLRRGVGDTAQTDEKHTLVVIARCVVILTPLFGLTWALGVGTMVSSTNRGIHIAFAFFNSLQGFFILVFGTLFDSKIRSLLSKNIPSPSTSSNQTRSTSAGISSLSGLNWISRLRGRRYIYRVSEATNSNSTGASESFVNI